jgi:hypothetical protein
MRLIFPQRCMGAAARPAHQRCKRRVGRGLRSPSGAELLHRQLHLFRLNHAILLKHLYVHIPYPG